MTGATAGSGRRVRNEQSPRTPARGDERSEDIDRLATRMIEVETNLNEIKEQMLTEKKMREMMKDQLTDAATVAKTEAYS